MANRVARCSEFPNDNPSLHDGAIWICAEIGAEASCELPAQREADEQAVSTVDAVEVGAELHETLVDPVAESAAEPEEEAPEEDAGVIEVVEDLAFEDALDEHGPGDTSPDPFEAFASVLVEVATMSGADPRAVGCLRALLGQARFEGMVLDESPTEALVAGALVERTDRGLVRAPGFTAMVLAWQGILRGESEDFGPCGAASLDEWSTNVVARVLGTSSRTEGIRRELRLRGVAAFGFVADAA
jgi:hypothetical protein